jgi:hypothetical protein
VKWILHLRSTSELAPIWIVRDFAIMPSNEVICCRACVLTAALAGSALIYRARAAKACNLPNVFVIQSSNNPFV